MDITTESYKGVRDFYPEDQFIQNYLFNTMRTAVQKYGYVEYSASILEPTELYKAKSGSEIVNEQTYSFKDRGDRDVTLRPEMTPTVARMVAAKKRELTFPLRWYSIPNLFRYEKPQRGRLREHWQLNVDLFGIPSIQADIEVIAVAAEVMKTFGAKPKDFEIRINSRKIIQNTLAEKGLSPEQGYAVMKLLDKKDKLPEAAFKAKAEEILGTVSIDDIVFAQDEDIKNIIKALAERGIKNVKFDTSLVRGFDYYTGTIFEVYDTDPKNPRALFGGGRYDELLSIFGQEKVPAVGFGMGDVTLRDFLEVRNLLPLYTPSAKLYIARADGGTDTSVEALAEALRAKNINVIVDISTKKVGDQLKKASKDSIPFSMVFGETEEKSKKYSIKNMATGETSEVDEAGLVRMLQ